MAPLLDTNASAVNEFLAHEDFRTATAFTLGLLALLALRCLLLAPRCRHRWHVCWTRVKRLTAEPAHKDGAPKASPDHVFDAPPDPYYALALLNAYIFAWALSFFGTTLLFTQSSSTGCQFLGAWSTLTFQGARILCFAILGLSIRSDAVGAHVYELWILLGYLLVRAGLAIATTAIDFFQLQPVSDHAAICEMRTSLVLGAVVQSLDLVVTLLLLLRFFTSTAQADAACKDLRGWRVWARAAFSRSVAKCLSVVLWIVASFAGSIGTTTYVGSWIPSALALLVVLCTYNAPHEVRVTEPAASSIHTKDLKILDPLFAGAKLAQYNESKINANVSPPSAPSTASRPKFLTSARVSTSSDAPRQKPLPAAAYFGLPPVPVRQSTEYSFLQGFRLSSLVDPPQDGSDGKHGLPERPKLARVHGDASCCTVPVRKSTALVTARPSSIKVKRATQNQDDEMTNSSKHDVVEAGMNEKHRLSVETKTPIDGYIISIKDDQPPTTLPLQIPLKKQLSRLTINTNVAKAYHVETE